MVARSIRERDLEADGIFTRQIWSSKYIAPGNIISWDNIQSIRAPKTSGAVPGRV